MRVIVWFSCGANSTVCIDRAIKKYGKGNITVVYCDVGGNGKTNGEHYDNKRFLKDVAIYFGIDIISLQSTKYSSPHDVYYKTKYLVGKQGARCTVELKKVLRFNFQEPDDIQIFGYAYDELDRQERFTKSFPEVVTDFILNDDKITSSTCKGLLLKWGLELPLMYKLGYGHNNCIGCVKGGKGYWNKIRVDFPEAFKEMSIIERELRVSCIKEKDKLSGSYKRIFLDELNPNEGNIKNEQISCDFICQSLDNL